MCKKKLPTPSSCVPASSFPSFPPSPFPFQQSSLSSFPFQNLALYTIFQIKPPLEICHSIFVFVLSPQFFITHTIWLLCKPSTHFFMLFSSRNSSSKKCMPSCLGN